MKTRKATLDEGVELSERSTQADTTHSQGFPNPSAIRLDRIQNQSGGSADHEPRQMYTPSSQNLPLPSGRTRKATLIGPRKGKKEKPQFEKACEAIETESPDVALKNTDGWTDVSNVLVRFDESEAKGHNENIDTLLVFAGLFSAILTAFIIEAYRLLQQDSTDATVRILLQISQQLSSFTVNPGLVNSTQAAITLMPFVPNRNSVWVNALWFISLILSLITASLGMLVKQWLREYLTSAHVSPRERCRVRWFRRPGLLAYKVSEIAALLPLLLQFALVFFFAGLYLFIQPVHSSIAAAVVVVVAIWFAFLLVTTFIPIMSPSCPYKTPFLKAIFRRARDFFDLIFSDLKGTALGIYFQWNHRGVSLFTEETDKWGDIQDDGEILFDAYKTFEDPNVWEMLTRCVDLNSSLKSLKTLTTLVTSRKASSDKSRKGSSVTWGQGECRSLVKSFIACFRKALSSTEECKKLDAGTADALCILQELAASLPEIDESDLALTHMAEHILQGSLRVSNAPEFVAACIVKTLPEASHLPQINSQVIEHVIDFAIGALENNSVAHLPSRPFELCRVILHCAEKTSEDGGRLLKKKLPQFTTQLAIMLGSWQLTYVDPELSCIRSHSALNMAMKYHHSQPGLINKALFEALHVSSLQFFDSIVTRHNLRGHLPRDGAVQQGQATQPVITDWEKILGGGEYVEVDLRGHGEYGDDWDHARTRVDCKHRMEFMLNYLVLGLNFREDFARYQILV